MDYNSRVKLISIFVAHRSGNIPEVFGLARAIEDNDVRERITKAMADSAAEFINGIHDDEVQAYLELFRQNG